MNISHLKTLFLQEYEMNQSAKELFEWMEKQMEPEPQSKNDVSKLLVAFIKWVGDGYDFENNAERIVGEYLSSHIDISEPKQPDTVQDFKSADQLFNAYCKPIKVGTDATIIVLTRPSAIKAMKEYAKQFTHKP